MVRSRMSDRIADSNGINKSASTRKKMKDESIFTLDLLNERVYMAKGVALNYTP